MSQKKHSTRILVSILVGILVLIIIWIVFHKNILNSVKNDSSSEETKNNSSQYNNSESDLQSENDGLLSQGTSSRDVTSPLNQHPSSVISTDSSLLLQAPELDNNEGIRWRSPRYKNLSSNLTTLYNEIQSNFALLNQYDESEYSPTSPNFQSITFLTQQANDLLYEYNQIQQELEEYAGEETQDFGEEETYDDTSEEDDEVYDGFYNQITNFSTQVFQFSGGMSQYLGYIPLNGWRTRHDVILRIDTMASTWQDGRVTLRGTVDTQGAPFNMELRFSNVTRNVSDYRDYCFLSGLAFKQGQTNIEDEQSIQSVIYDLFNILNNIGKYQRSKVLFAYPKPNNPDEVVYSDVAQTRPGESIPFVVSVDNLDPKGFYTFGIVDPTFRIPIPLQNFGLSLPITVNITGNDPTGLLSSYMFAGPSCFDILNRYYPIVSIDTTQSSVTSGTGYKTSNDGKQIPDRNGTAILKGTLTLSDLFQPHPLLPNLQNQRVRIPMYASYGGAPDYDTSGTNPGDPVIPLSPINESLLTRHTPIIYFDGVQGQPIPWDMTFPNIHTTDFVAFYDPATNEKLLGPIQFSSLGDTTDIVSAFGERWYYFTNTIDTLRSTPTTIFYQRSRLFMAKNECLTHALRALGQSVPCYSTNIPNITVIMDQPEGINDADFTTTILARPTDSFVSMKHARLAGTVDTRGIDTNLILEYYSKSNDVPTISDIPPYDAENFLVAKRMYPIKINTVINETKPIKFTFMDLEPNTTYYYRIIDTTLTPLRDYNIAEGIFTTPKSDMSSIAGGELTIDSDLLIPPIVTGNITIDEDAGLVPCGNPDQAPCDYNKFIKLLHNIINYVLLLLGPIAAVVFAYAGFILLTANGAPDKITKARKIFLNTAIGIVIILCAWLIVAEILHFIGLDPSYFLLDISSMNW